MTSSPYRPSPLRLSDTSWVTTGIFDEPVSGRAAAASGSSSLDLVPAPRASDLQIVLRTKDHAAYYDASSNELSLQKRSLPRSPGASTSNEDSNQEAPLVPHRNDPSTSQSLLQRFRRFASLESSANQTICPTCARPWPLGEADPLDTQFDTNPADRESPCFIAPNYFRLLAQATHTSTSSSNASSTALPRNRFESASGSSTPLPSGASTPPEPINHASEAQGYYARFFVELKRLGRGARGQVFLCQHVLNGNKLGKYAIKKIPVGDHAQSLLQSLNEVHLMESLHHPHLIHYQHAWIERCQLSAFAPEVPTLFVLMMAANGGSLADWISARAGDAEGVAEEVGLDSPRVGGAGGGSGTRASGGEGGQEKTGRKGEDDVGTINPAERLKIERLKTALRQRRANRSATTAFTSTSPPPRPVTTPPISMQAGVHLLRTDEIYSLLTDITSGLAFLHSRGILHLDIKPGNILLHWDDDSLIPRAMLSDFGSSLLLHDNWTRTRSGHTGTMEYMSPETILVNPLTGRLDELSSKSDIWSLGLLERMLCVDPTKRPSCKEVLQVLSAKAKQEERGGRQRRKHKHDGSADAKNEGVSLALYRPSALPPLLATTDVAAHQNTPSTPLNTFATLYTRWMQTLPPRPTAVTVAFLKCLSPTLLFGASTLDAIYVTILLLALIDLSHSEEEGGRIGGGARRGGGRWSRRVSVGCWMGHLVLLAIIGGWRGRVR